ncbi:arsenite efflux transporter metallochaperone ArsD [Alicyclobacillus tolerans]|uniref:arsenite efflux transporter metallochaperone ArsD n=1 Tax=Alicyclobacillus tolerans TaxID=90970 RepID=UPI001F02FD61|nr:arsenite efflux transporter metallochaperone ArsD [Alicyclobacillus tolerans]MCF8565898.1 arsenite efflux transporter metallochaperone ArsD [Alicyclobacillus tolerans]
MKIDFFDPEMCCSTGVCGTSPDPELIRVGEMVEKLKADGYAVARHMLSRDSAAFTSNQHVYETMLKHGMKVLPIVAVDGEIRTMGRYPQMDELFASKES